VPVALKIRLIITLYETFASRNSTKTSGRLLNMSWRGYRVFEKQQRRCLPPSNQCFQQHMRSSVGCRTISRTYSGMFSRLNHHHERQRCASVPPLPVAGTRRRRSRDSTPSEVSEQLGDDQLTKSPHTRRVVKRGRATSPTRTPTFQPQQMPLPSTLFTFNSGEPPAPPPVAPLVIPSSKAATRPAASEDMLHLERLLDLVLATAVIIRTTSPQTGLLTTHSRSVLNAIQAMVSPAKPTTASVAQAATPQKSYAQATTTPARPDHPPATIPQAPPAGPRKRKTKPVSPIKTHHSPQKLILRWDTPLTVSPEHLLELVESTRKVVCLGHSEQRVAAANISPAGCLILHARPPFTARELLPDVDEILESLAKITAGLDMDNMGQPEAQLDVPWHSVVIHDVPASMAVASIEDSTFSDKIQEALEMSAANYKDSQLLVRQEVWEAQGRETVSIRVRFEDPSGVPKFLSRGTVIMGKKCRVSRYQPRKRHGPNLMQDPPRPNSDS